MCRLYVWTLASFGQILTPNRGIVSHRPRDLGVGAGSQGVDGTSACISPVPRSTLDKFFCLLFDIL
jgi:hypothetical protein